MYYEVPFGIDIPLAVFVWFEAATSSIDIHCRLARCPLELRVAQNPDRENVCANERASEQASERERERKREKDREEKTSFCGFSCATRSL